MHDVDFYELLGVRADASGEQIKSAYRALARTMHPDRGGTAGTFRLLREAYETLSDPVRRAEYDGPAEGDAAVPEQPVATTATRTRTRPARAHRARRFGDDPDYVPQEVRLDVGDIPWWDDVATARRVRYARQNTPGRAPGVAAGVAVLSLALSLPFGPTLPLVLCWLVLAGVAVVGGHLFLRRGLGSWRAARAFRDEFAGHTVFGTPGTDRDQVGERLTADLLSRYLSRLPAVRIFHGLSWPGSVFADVDHAVLCGRRLVLVESKLWLPGHYTSDAAGGLLRDGRRFRGGGSTLAEGLEAFRTLLPDVEVRGALVLYPSRAGRITAGSAHGEAPPLTPEAFVRDIGGWLAADPSTLDRQVFRAVLGQVS